MYDELIEVDPGESLKVIVVVNLRNKKSFSRFVDISHLKKYLRECLDCYKGDFEHGRI